VGNTLAKSAITIHFSMKWWWYRSCTRSKCL